MTRSIILIPPHNLLLSKHEINILIIQSKLLTELNNSHIKLYQLGTIVSNKRLFYNR